MLSIFAGKKTRYKRYFDNMPFLRLILYPLSFLYGILMMLRNFFFDLRILPVEHFSIPLISVGNLSFGGTGKTPHIEYLIRLLSPGFVIGELSRGYGRKSKGFIIVSRRSQAKFIGDEPLQLAKKFDGIKVAVDGNRKRGIQQLIQKYPDLDLILLDDAFQHRYIKPGLSILLTDYHHLFTEDYLLPSGTLREFPYGARRADIIIVTKTPKIFSPITRRRILEDINPGTHQKLLFSYLKYSDPLPVFESQQNIYPEKVKDILLITGIANNDLLCEYLQRRCSELVVMKFPDHYLFKEQDIKIIVKRFNDFLSKKKVILTTEKDVMRLKTPEFSTFLKNLPLFYLPVEIEFHGDDKEIFNNYILNYVGQNKGDHCLSRNPSKG